MGNKMGIIRDAGNELYLINEALSQRERNYDYRMVEKTNALKGRTAKMVVQNNHAVNGNLMMPPFPEGMQMAMFGMGCFWGVEKLFWNIDGVYSTQVGYSMGYTPNPMYREVCSEKTGHAEVVRVVFDPHTVDYVRLLNEFWQNHDPTMGMAQGNDYGTRYRSGIYYYNNEQKELAEQSCDLYAEQLKKCHYDPITTEILPADEFYYAEDYHQQYLHKNVGGYCGIRGTGIPFQLHLQRTVTLNNELLTKLIVEAEDDYSTDDKNQASGGHVPDNQTPKDADEKDQDYKNQPSSSRAADNQTSKKQAGVPKK